jgi:hypothetical protein
MARAATRAGNGASGQTRPKVFDNAADAIAEVHQRFEQRVTLDNPRLIERYLKSELRFLVHFLFEGTSDYTAGPPRLARQGLKSVIQSFAGAGCYGPLSIKVGTGWRHAGIAYPVDAAVAHEEMAVATVGLPNRRGQRRAIEPVGRHTPARTPVCRK